MSCGSQGFREAISTTQSIGRNGAEAVAYIKREGQYTNRDEPRCRRYPFGLEDASDGRFPGARMAARAAGIRGIPAGLTPPIKCRRESRLRLGANSFLVKPMDFRDYADLGRLIRHYWLKMPRRPSPSGPPASERTKRVESHVP